MDHDFFQVISFFFPLSSPYFFTQTLTVFVMYCWFRPGETKATALGDNTRRSSSRTNSPDGTDQCHSHPCGCADHPFHAHARFGDAIATRRVLSGRRIVARSLALRWVAIAPFVEQVLSLLNRAAMTLPTVRYAEKMSNGATPNPVGCRVQGLPDTPNAVAAAWFLQSHIKARPDLCVRSS